MRVQTGGGGEQGVKTELAAVAHKERKRKKTGVALLCFARMIF
jgi:hypothetical protein